jgi:hypothetical protein
MPSFTTLFAMPTSVTFGKDSATELFFNVTDTAGDTPSGSVTVKAQQGNGDKVLCTGDVFFGNGSCRMDDTALLPGTRQLFAVYSGDASFASSQSGLVPLEVNRAVTEPAMTQSDFQLTFGHEHADTITVTVGPTVPGQNPPGGGFNVTADIPGGPTQICSGTIIQGTGTCAPDDSALPVGLFNIEAHYAGDDIYRPGDAPAAPIKISKGDSTTTLGLPATLAFDKENGAKVSYSVGPHISVPPSGQVSVSALSAATGQTTPICSGSAGAGSCQMTARQLAPGKYLVTATYGGDTNYAGSSSAATPFTITKVPTQTLLTRSPARVRFGNEQAEHISVQVRARDGSTPGGKVTVRAGTIRLCLITLSSGTGRCTLTARQLRVGTYQLVASYPGSAQLARSASAKVTLVVTR